MRSRHGDASGGSTTTRDWAGFYAATDGREPRALFSRALAIWDGAPGQAIDVGFGDGTKHWHVFSLIARVPDHG